MFALRTFSHYRMILDRLLRVVFVFSLVVYDTVLAIEILESAQYISVRNGSEKGVIIDCPYALAVEDAAGLEVKWYYNNKPRPVYQWIPGNKPQDLGILSDRLDKTYKVSDDRLSTHRALAIPDPTTELSGTYTCWVSNFKKEVNMVAHLIVYTPAKEIEIRAHRGINKKSLLVDCRVEGIFPLPELQLFEVKPNSTQDEERNRTLIEGVRVESFYDEDNLTHTMTAEKEFEVSDLDPDVGFLCSITIPNTDYKEEKMASIQTDESYFSAGLATELVAPMKIFFLIKICTSFWIPYL